MNNLILFIEALHTHVTSPHNLGRKHTKGFAS